MERRVLIAGNWKMNKTPEESEAFARSLLFLESTADIDILILPPFTSLDRLGKMLDETGISLGAQDIHFEPGGAFTGAISARMILACGCRYVLVGHSECRHVFGDSDETVEKKLHAALDAELRPILCIGERLDERRAGDTESLLSRQLSIALADVQSKAMDRITIAYEPVWAIGTGETATPAQAEQACAFVRSWVASRFGDAFAQRTRILYGGSVKPENAAALLEEPEIDGALIGGASLDVEAFAAIIDAVPGGRR